MSANVNCVITTLANSNSFWRRTYSLGIKKMCNDIFGPNRRSEQESYDWITFVRFTSSHQRKKINYSLHRFVSVSGQSFFFSRLYLIVTRERHKEGTELLIERRLSCGTVYTYKVVTIQEPTTWFIFYRRLSTVSPCTCWACHQSVPSGQPQLHLSFIQHRPKLDDSWTRQTYSEGL